MSAVASVESQSCAARHRADVPRAADIRIGISGWTYAPWRGSFYPKGLPQKAELRHAARQFRSIEINGTFYGLQKPDSFARWTEETPEGFVFALKAPRFITHVRRLREPATPLANFLASGLLRLGPKLGPILWQFPPTFRFDSALMGKRKPLATVDAVFELAWNSVMLG